MSRLAESLLLALAASSSALATLEMQVRDPGGHALRDVAQRKAKCKSPQERLVY